MDWLCGLSEPEVCACGRRYTMLYCCLVANGLASALVNPAQGAFTAVVTPMEKRGQAEGIRRQSADVVSLAGPVGLGLLADLTSCPAAIGLTSLMMATTCALHNVSPVAFCASVDGGALTMWQTDSSIRWPTPPPWRPATTRPTRMPELRNFQMLFSDSCDRTCRARREYGRKIPGEEGAARPAAAESKVPNVLIHIHTSQPCSAVQIPAPTNPSLPLIQEGPVARAGPKHPAPSAQPRKAHSECARARTASPVSRRTAPGLAAATRHVWHSPGRPIRAQPRNRLLP